MTAPNRLFVPQAVLDQWLSEDRVAVEGEVMVTQPEGHRLDLVTAVRFDVEVTSGEDPHGLIGKVKDLEQLAAIGAEHYADSVILGDSAYQVLEGFAGVPEIDEESGVATGSSLAAATRAAVGEGTGSGELDLLARFLGSR